MVDQVYWGICYKLSYIIIIILVARLLLKLGLGLFSIFVQGLFIHEARLPIVMVDARLLLFAPGIFARCGISGRSIILPRYKGPINLSLTLLFLFGPIGLCGSGAYLSILSVPSGFFSPASIARSSFKAWLRALRLTCTAKNTAIRSTMITATAMPIPRPAFAPDVMSRLSRPYDIGDAAAVLNKT